MSLLTRDLGRGRSADAALVDDASSLGWAELDRRVNQAIHLLRELGLANGDVVALMAGNQQASVVLTLAALQSGVLLVPVNWHWVADELAYVLDDAGAKALVVDERWLEVAEATGFDGDRLVVTTAPSSGAVRSWDEALDGMPADEPDEAVRGGVMFYTSGTTGRPKGVRGTLGVVGGDAAMWQFLASMSDSFGLPAEAAVFLLAGPMYHSAQWVYSMFSLLSGATVVMQHQFDAEGLLALVERHRVTNLHLVPTQFTRLLRLPDDVRRAHDTSSLVSVHHGAAPCPASVKRSMIEWWGPIVTEYYGGTEGGFISMISAEEWLQRPQSVGRPVPIVEVTVTDDAGNELPPNTPGQLWFRSLLGSDFEYHNAPEKTAGAHRTAGTGTLGDVGYLDEDGYLYLSDRKIDMIISGGVNIYPAEIEAVLTEHPAVDSAAVFGIPDDEFGESVVAVVEAPVPGAGLVDELLELCTARLAGYKRPRRIDVVDELPRSAAGKVQKRELRDPHWAGAARSI